MDKYEYKVRAEEINSLIEQKKYAEAVKIADTIDWRRVKSAKMLCKVSELYKMNRRYEDSKEILLLADEHLPDSRNIIYSLCELSIKLEDIVPAVEYYKQFIQIAPRDTKRYILQYRLYEAQDVSLEERIAVLEEYKKRDYCEKWGYELAYLYHRIGLATRCVEECDELILWFGEGKYVIKAMELKMLHAPLTSSQQEKYDRRFESQSNAYVVKKPDESKEAAMEKANLAAKLLLESANEPVMSSVSMETIPSMPIQIKSVEVSNAPTTRIPSKNVQSELENGGDTIKIEVPEIPVSEPAEDVEFEVKTMDVGKYNTINLQKELAQNLAAVMQQEDMEATDATKAIPVNSINDLVPDEEPAEEAEKERVIVEEFFTEEESEEEEAAMAEEQPEEAAESESEIEPESEIESEAESESEAEPEPQPFTDTAVTRAVIEEVRKVLGDEPRETITEEDLLNSLNDSEDSEEQPPQEEISEESSVEEFAGFEYSEPVIIDAVSETEEDNVSIEPLPGIFSAPTEAEDTVSSSPIIIESIPQSEIDAEEIPVEEHEEEILDELHIPPTFEYKEPVIVEPEITEPEVTEPEVAEPETIEPETTESEIREPVPVETPVILQPVSPIQGVSGVAPVQAENPDAPLVEKQITGQLTFNDIVAGWEGTKKAAEEKRLEEMRKKVMAETGPMLQPPEESSDTVYPTDLDMMAPVLNVFDKSTESVLTPDDEVEELTDIQPPTMNTAEINGLEEKLLSSYETVQKQQITTPLEPIDISGISIGNTDRIEMEKKDFDSELERQVLEALEDKDPEPEAKNVFHTADFKIDEPKEESKAVFHTEDFKIDEPKTEKEEKSELRPVAGAVTEMLGPIEPTPPRHNGPRLLTKEEKDLFGALSQTKKMQEDIANAIDHISLYPSEGNVLITGEKGVGTVDFAKNLIKVLASADKRFSGRVAKVTGEQLNTRNIKDTLNGLHNGALIVEHAGELTDFALIALSDYLRETHQNGIILFFEDTKMGMGSLCAKENMPIDSFNIKVDISVLDNDGLVNYGKEYALAQDYSIDEMGVLALYTRISERQTIEHAVTVEEVKQLVDEAILKSQKGSVGHFMDVILKKRYDDDDMIILREKDFL